MSGYSQRLPHLSNLLMFKAAAQQLNFTSGARDLKVTQAEQFPISQPTVERLECKIDTSNGEFA